MPDIKTQLVLERLRLLRERAAVHVAVLPIPVVLTFLMFWGLVDPRMMYAWGIAMATLWAWWFYVWRAMGNNVQTLPQARQAIEKRENIAFNLYNGICWGSYSFLSHSPSALEYHMMGTLGISMLVAVMVISFEGIRSRALYATIIPLVTPLLVIELMMGTAFHAITGLVVLTFTISMIFFGYHHNTLLQNSQKMRLQLAEEKERAEAANVSKSRFLAAASHDLRQPLHALSLFSGVLQERVSDPGAAGVVANISRSIAGLDSLFNALLDVSKLDAGTVKPVKRTFFLDKIMLQLDAEFGELARRKGLQWQCEATEEVVKSDPVLLDTVLRNLISNAIRYTHSGSVSVRCWREMEFTHIEVRDTGIGIPADKRQEIFQEFSQLNNPERDRSKGLGLGLAIVNRLTDLLDIRLDFDSEPNRGSRFSLAVPLGLASEIIEKPVEITSGLQDTLDGTRVLVVDDEADIRSGMRTLLDGWGCNVQEAASQDEVLELLGKENHVPNVIIADYRLRQNRTGVQVIESVRQALHAEVPAIVITGDTAPDRLQEAESSGFVLLHKPVQPATLRALLLDVKAGKLE